jgi:hypothetical protein
MAIDLESTVVRDQEPMAASVDNEVVMLSARAAAYFGLNGVGTAIWGLLEQPRKVSEVCTELTGLYDVDLATCEQHVLGFLNEMHGHGLVRLAHATEHP